MGRFEKYRNKDSRCHYSFQDDPLGYCWSYAHHVDGNEEFRDMGAICPTCDFWRESLNQDPDDQPGEDGE